ncbi:hypothetical protein BVRB_016890, partial [Beta vulgaris subsp. vulgaris]
MGQNSWWIIQTSSLLVLTTYICVAAFNNLAPPLIAFTESR